MSKNNKSILIAVISGVAVCALCITVILLIPTKEPDYSGEIYPDYYDEVIYDEDEIDEAEDFQEYLDEFFNGDEDYYNEYSELDDEYCEEGCSDDEDEDTYYDDDELSDEVDTYSSALDYFFENE